MKLILKDVGMIKEASISLDGLTVIAGENDTGKSTVGKILFALMRTHTFYKYGNKPKKPLKIFNWLLKQIFKDRVIYKECKIESNNLLITPFEINSDFFFDALFIETPYVMNMFDTFKTIQPFINSQNPLDIFIDYPYVAWDVYIKSYNKSQYLPKTDFNDVFKFIKECINGEWKFIEEKKEWRFFKENKDFQINNVAMGIKQFGLIYILLKNNYISKNRILIIDEPEVHLHPKWQIEYAKLIVELVKRDIKVLVTSHSPFFIEALEILSKDLDSNFYLANRENNYSIIKEADLNKIYELLSESIDTLEEMQIESKKW